MNINPNDSKEVKINKTQTQAVWDNRTSVLTVNIDSDGNKVDHNSASAGGVEIYPKEDFKSIVFKTLKRNFISKSRRFTTFFGHFMEIHETFSPGG